MPDEVEFFLNGIQVGSEGHFISLDIKNLSLEGREL